MDSAVYLAKGVRLIGKWPHRWVCRIFGHRDTAQATTEINQFVSMRVIYCARCRLLERIETIEMLGGPNISLELRVEHKP